MTDFSDRDFVDETDGDEDPNREREDRVPGQEDAPPETDPDTDLPQPAGPGVS